MASVKMPALFISHGGPPLAISPKDTTHIFLKTKLPLLLPRPKAIVCVSAHWETNAFSVTSNAKPRTIHDFGGFSPALYKMQYPAPGDPELAKRIVSMIKAAGLPSQEDDSWGFDHGTWIPLTLMFPKADIPVLQISLTRDLDASKLLRLGKALKPLRDEGVLLIGSGSTTHNLGELEWEDPEAPPVAWAMDFSNYVHKTLELTGASREQELLKYKERPTTRLAHPRAEHFVPLFFSLGTADLEAKVQILNRGITMSSMDLSAFLWE